MQLMISAEKIEHLEVHSHYTHNRVAKCSFCRATVLTPGESVPESEVAGIDEKTGMLICRHCVDSYISENLMTA